MISFNIYSDTNSEITHLIVQIKISKRYIIIRTRSSVDKNAIRPGTWVLRDVSHAPGPSYRDHRRRYETTEPPSTNLLTLFQLNLLLSEQNSHNRIKHDNATRSVCILSAAALQTS